MSPCRWAFATSRSRNPPDSIWATTSAVRRADTSNRPCRALTIATPSASSGMPTTTTTISWSTHVYYRGDGESRWLLLKDNLTDKAYSFDASLLPDGGYTIKVVASDAPSHSPGEALTATKQSRRFEVDTTPPRVENLTATVEGTQIHVRFRAEDGFSTIKRAEYSVDAGDWKYVEPVGQLSDAKVEDYDFKVRCRI